MIGARETAKEGLPDDKVDRWSEVKRGTRRLRDVSVAGRSDP
jgi:hypothetical protein